ncbi:MAG: HAMP domain-containing protein [Ignavibacteriota bacterium]
MRKGNLKYRVQVKAVDELGFLVRGFNQMTEELESSAAELDRRRRFTEAILESIPTGVLSIGADGSIQLVNQALLKIFPPGQVVRATRLEDLFSRADTAEIKYLMKRARRTGLAARQLDLSIENRTLNLSVTVAALEEKLTSGFVIVSRTPANSCVPRKPPPGTKWPAGWRTKSRIRSPPSLSRRSASTARWTVSTCRTRPRALFANVPTPFRSRWTL